MTHIIWFSLLLIALPSIASAQNKTFTEFGRNVGGIPTIIYYPGYPQQDASFISHQPDIPSGSAFDQTSAIQWNSQGNTGFAENDDIIHSLSLAALDPNTNTFNSEWSNSEEELLGTSAERSHSDFPPDLLPLLENTSNLKWETETGVAIPQSSQLPVVQDIVHSSGNDNIPDNFGLAQSVPDTYFHSNEWRSNHENYQLPVTQAPSSIGNINLKIYFNKYYM